MIRPFTAATWRLTAAMSAAGPSTMKQRPSSQGTARASTRVRELGVGVRRENRAEGRQPGADRADESEIQRAPGHVVEDLPQGQQAVTLVFAGLERLDDRVGLAPPGLDPFGSAREQVGRPGHDGRLIARRPRPVPAVLRRQSLLGREALRQLVQREILGPPLPHLDLDGTGAGQRRRRTHGIRARTQHLEPARGGGTQHHRGASAPNSARLNERRAQALELHRDEGEIGEQTGRLQQEDVEQVAQAVIEVAAQRPGAIRRGREELPLMVEERGGEPVQALRGSGDAMRRAAPAPAVEPHLRQVAALCRRIDERVQPGCPQSGAIQLSLHPDEAGEERVARHPIRSPARPETLTERRQLRQPLHPPDRRAPGLRNPARCGFDLRAVDGPDRRGRCRARRSHPTARPPRASAP